MNTQYPYYQSDIPQNVLPEGVLSEDFDESYFTKQKENFIPKKTMLRWPLLFFFVNCVMIVSALSLCLAPASTYIALAY